MNSDVVSCSGGFGMTATRISVSHTINIIKGTASTTNHCNTVASQPLRRGPFMISAFTLMQTCHCRCTSNERCRGASLLSVNCARSAERCR